MNNKRLYSLDVFRGLTMFLLIAEAAGVYEALSGLSENSPFFHKVAEQFHHHPWYGPRFWDLIQPYFMFIVGMAMPFSLKSRLAKGSKQQATKHI